MSVAGFPAYRHPWTLLNPVTRYTYLVESSTAIGGHMAQLDKTFSTNDCAICTISPRLTAVGNYRNIEIFTLADLSKLTGDYKRILEFRGDSYLVNSESGIYYVTYEDGTAVSL